MDPYYGLSTVQPTIAPQPSSSTSFLSSKTIAIIVGCILLIGLVLVFVIRRGKQSQQVNDASPMQGNTQGRTQASSSSSKGQKTIGSGGTISGIEGEAKWATDPPEAKLATFAFEPKTRPSYVPNQKGVIAIKPAGNPPYKLVGCNSMGAYAIRWNGRYLTVSSPNSVVWTDEKQEPASCFKLVPGYCGSGSNYIMLRSMANKHFLRAEDTYGQLICKDTPTARTANSYCWKLNPETATRQPCGPQYSYDLGRIVDVPCNVKEMPDGNNSCSTVTAGYQANCCIKKKGSAKQDAFCDDTIFPKVVGRSLQEAILYIRTRRPDLSLKPCPEPCTTQAVPVQSPNVVVIPYDARSNIVTSTPRRLV